MENKARRSELAMYLLPRTSDSVYKSMLRKKWIGKPPKYFEVLAFSLAMGVIFSFFLNDQQQQVVGKGDANGDTNGTTNNSNNSTSAGQGQGAECLSGMLNKILRRIDMAIEDEGFVVQQEGHLRRVWSLVRMNPYYKNGNNNGNNLARLRRSL